MFISEEHSETSKMREHLLCEILCQWVHAWKLMRVQELRTNLEKKNGLYSPLQLNAMPRSGSSLYLIFHTLLLLSAQLSICFSDLVKLWPHLTYSPTWMCSEVAQVAFQLHELMYFQTYSLLFECSEQWQEMAASCPRFHDCNRVCTLFEWMQIFHCSQVLMQDVQNVHCVRI